MFCESRRDASVFFGLAVRLFHRRIGKEKEKEKIKKEKTRKKKMDEIGKKQVDEKKDKKKKWKEKKTKKRRVLVGFNLNFF